MTKEQREELKKDFFNEFKDKSIRFREDDGSFSMGGYEMWEWIESRLESEVEKAKKEGRHELVKEIRKAIKEDMENTDTEESHFNIDKDIVKILDDKEITKMFAGDNDDMDLYGGWGWYS